MQKYRAKIDHIFQRVNVQGNCCDQLIAFLLLIGISHAENAQNPSDSTQLLINLAAISFGQCKSFYVQYHCINSQHYCHNFEVGTFGNTHSMTSTLKPRCCCRSIQSKLNRPYQQGYYLVFNIMRLGRAISHEPVIGQKAM